MHVVIAAAIVLATIAAMEYVAMAVHRHVMHGWGWGWHRSHHQKRRRGLEKNDLYAVVFAMPALLLTAAASPAGPAYWCGIGVALYGLLYAIVHDGLVHRRLPVHLQVRHRYVRRLVQAHRLHHAVRSRDGCVSFGFLYAPPLPVLRKRLRERMKKAER
ncbi:MAG: sterol desaturase family protein [Alphaproteobacteria bacterium]